MNLDFLAGIFASPLNIILTVIDIGIVSYVFYRLLGLITGTRAVQLLKGLVWLLVFTVVTGYLNLTMINWLLEKMWILFAITLPIVFQPELRRILEQIGRGSFFTPHVKKNSQQEDYLIKEIGDAAAVLSKNRVGALIVIAGKTGIAEHMESGTELDALVSSSLLVNIFFPNSPLHDGAVVIDEGRIKKAGCFLPLTDNPNLDGRLGTRHRAGLGITEVSDVICIIVSEETGDISIAYEGELKGHYDETSLRLALKDEFTDTTGWRDTLKRRWFGEHKDGNS